MLTGARRWIPSVAITAGLVLVGAPDDSNAAALHHVQYKAYKNPRFGFRLVRPKAFHADPPPADGDGRGWTADHGRVALSAYGSNNGGLEYNPKQQERADEYGLHVTYKNVSGHVVTVSGYRHTHTIVYERDWVGPGNIDTTYWVYPRSQRKKWNALLLHTVDSFKPGPLNVGR